MGIKDNRSKNPLNNPIISIFPPGKESKMKYDKGKVGMGEGMSNPRLFNNSSLKHSRRECMRRWKESKMRRVKAHKEQTSCKTNQ